MSPTFLCLPYIEKVAQALRLWRQTGGMALAKLNKASRDRPALLLFTVISFSTFSSTALFLYI